MGDSTRHLSRARGRGVALAGAFALLCATPLFASERIACVQWQLGALGYFSGDASGKIDKETREAARKAFRALGSDVDLELPLRDRTAGQWCRALGNSDPGLQAFWPSRDPVQIYTDTIEGEVKQALLQGLFDKSAAFFGETYDQQLAGSFAIIGTDAPEQLMPYLNRALKDRGRAGRTRPLPICTDKATGAVANRGFVALCWPAPPAYSDANIAKLVENLGPVMVHEHVHQFQYELARDVPAQRDRKGHMLLGPAWMVEGTAEVFEAQFRDLTGTDTAGQTFFQTQTPARRGRAKLADLRASGSVKSSSEYGIARFGAFLLAQRYGPQTLFAYFERLGEVKNQDKAFELAFGLPMAQFEAEFEDLRRNFKAARDWTKRGP